MVEPDATQEGGLDQVAVEALIAGKKLDKLKLRTKYKEWGDEGELLPEAFDHAPDETEVRAALFNISQLESFRSSGIEAAKMKYEMNNATG